MNWNVNWCEICNSLWFMLKETMFESEGSISSMANNKAFSCEGKLCNTLITEMVHGS